MKEPKKPVKKVVKKPEVKKPRVKAIDDRPRFMLILDMIQVNGWSLDKSLKVSKMSTETFYKWVENDPDNAKLYTCACARRADAIFEEIFDIADDTKNDTTQVFDRTGKKIDVPDMEWIQRSKLRVDVRKWAAAKLNPRKYGEKLDLTSDNEAIKPSTIIVQLGNGKAPDETTE